MKHTTQPIFLPWRRSAISGACVYFSEIHWYDAHYTGQSPPHLDVIQHLVAWVLVLFEFIWLELARTIYIRCIYGIFGREITIYVLANPTYDTHYTAQPQSSHLDVIQQRCVPLLYASVSFNLIWHTLHSTQASHLPTLTSFSIWWRVSLSIKLIFFTVSEIYWWHTHYTVHRPATSPPWRHSASGGGCPCPWRWPSSLFLEFIDDTYYTVHRPVTSPPWHRSASGGGCLCP